MKQYEISARAQADLRFIWPYISEDSATAADRLIRRLAAVFARLTLNPHLGRSRPELGLGAYRSYPVGQYLILYTVRMNVLISHVIHGRRDLDRHPFDVS